MNMCMSCIYIGIHTHTHTYIYIYMYESTCIYVYELMGNMYIFTYIHMNILRRQESLAVYASSPFAHVKKR